MNNPLMETDPIFQRAGGDSGASENIPERMEEILTAVNDPVQGLSRRRGDSHHEMIIYWSEEDQAFVAQVPELPGCMADGATYQEALVNTEAVIHEWIETARQLGRPIPEAKGRIESSSR